MPLIIPLRNRLSLIDGTTSSYFVLQNLEGSSTQQVHEVENYEEEKSDDHLPPARNEEDLWSEVLDFVRQESLHSFSNDELRKALKGNNNATSLVVVAGDEETSRHLNIDFKSKTTSIMETCPQYTPTHDDTRTDDDDDEQSSSTKRRHCMSESLRLIRKVSSQRLLANALSSAGNLTSYCRME